MEKQKCNPIIRNKASLNSLLDHLFGEKTILCLCLLLETKILFFRRIKKKRCTAKNPTSE